MKLEEITGIDSKKIELLKKLKIENIEDLLVHYPRRYERHPYPVQIKDVSEGKCAIDVYVNRRFSVGSNGTRSLYVADSTGFLTLRWFRAPYIDKIIRPGNRYVFYGNVSLFNGKFCMAQPLFYSPEEYSKKAGCYMPVYPLTKGLTNDNLFQIVLQVLQEMEEPRDIIPDFIRYQFGLISKGDAIRCIHYPANEEVAEMARRRLAFDEFFSLIYNIRYRAMMKGSNPCVIAGHPSADALIVALPYPLTGSQQQAFSDIYNDLRGNMASDRLVQGDVGSGKTIVALLAMLTMADHNYQSALMAPTEVLAQQHYTEMVNCLERIGKLQDFCPVLLTGSMKEREKRVKRKMIQDGTAKIIIGTHAIIQDKVVYKNLSLAIVDEQHRFGVEQRDALSQKGKGTVHTLVMTATPIPATTGKVLFGGMDLSVMRDKPANRKPIISQVFNENTRNKAYEILWMELQKGHQAYVICPMVDENEDEKKSVEGYSEQLKKVFPSITMEVMHGKMKAVEKQVAMDKFSSGESKIMIATTVVEVGVNVPNATVILIENADVFGILQLHQLRGRVGRGECQSYCLFMNSCLEDNEKLNVLERTNDGFEVAEADYRMRKAGNILGTQQSGDMGFKLADMVRDEVIMQQASYAADTMINIYKNMQSAII